MSDPQSGSNAVKRDGLDLRPYMTREPVVVALLSTLAMACFAAVSGMSSMYHAQQRSLATQWFSRGQTDLNERRYAPAAAEFRTALLYSRDNYSYQFDLAEALVGQKRIDEASAYLVNLWDREPENGLVNLELGRIAAGKRQPEQALRYFHNAIYATWPDDQGEARQEARLELIDYLLKNNYKPQARSELIALAANVRDDSPRLVHVGDLFVEAQDDSDALAAYRRSLKASTSPDSAALAGAGRAAFELGRYTEAQQYLQAAAAAGSDDPAIAVRLATAKLVLQMDPFRRKIPATERDRDIIAAFSAAGERLKSCQAAAPQPQAAAPEDLSGTWSKIKPKITSRGLRQNPDLGETAMELVFKIERESAACGSPTTTDRALLLIAKRHEGN